LGVVEGKICIVTDGAGSLKLASARALLAERAKLSLVDLDGNKLNFARRTNSLPTGRRLSPPTLPKPHRRANMSAIPFHAGVSSTCSSATPAMTAR
jgi:hypothetical protein